MLRWVESDCCIWDLFPVVDARAPTTAAKPARLVDARCISRSKDQA